MLLVRLVVLSLLAVSVNTGCGDKKKDKSEPPKKELADVEGIQALPASATTLIGLDVTQLSKSVVVTRALQQMFARDQTLEAELQAVLDACKIDLKKDVASATIALLPRAGEHDSLLVAKGKFSESDISTCLGRFFSENGGRLETAEFEDRAIYHQVSAKDAGGGVWISFGAKNTILVASAREALELALSKGPKLSNTKDGMARLAPRTQLDATIWGMTSLTDQIGGALVAATGGQVKPARSIVGSASLTTGLSLTLQVEMHSAEDAKTLISLMSTQIKGAALILQIEKLGPLIKKLEFSTEGEWASVRWQLDDQELADLMGASMSGLSLGIDSPEQSDQNPAPMSDSPESDAGVAESDAAASVERKQEDGN